MSEGRPDPIVKAAESTKLPREIRNRLGMATDPVPEGMVLDVKPKHHFEIKPEHHDGDKPPSDEGPYTNEQRTDYEKEMQKMQAEAAKNEANNWGGGLASPSSNQMRMESRRRNQNWQGSKHMDTVYRSK